MAANVILSGINLSIELATVVAPELVVLGRAIAELFRAHPTMTSAQFQELVTSMANDVHATNAATLAVLAGIPDTPPPPGA